MKLQRGFDLGLFEKKRKQSSIAVTPAEYDDIGEILHELGYRTEEIRVRDLDDVDLLRRFSTVFVNCSGEIIDARARSIGSFVLSGGTLYASDFASFPIERTFSNLRGAFRESSYVGMVDAEIVDLGLREVLGCTQIELNFDLAGWRYLSSSYRDIRAYIEGRERSDGQYPLLFSFKHGAGTVIFTSFHNHAQVSDKERRLLEFLALRPVLSRVAEQSTTIVQAARLSPHLELVDKIRQGEWSAPRSFDVYLAEHVKLLLNWEGVATVEMIVSCPDGSLYRQVTGDKPPLQVDVAGQPGSWSYQIRAIRTNLPSLAYVVTVGKRRVSPRCPFCGKTVRTQAKFCNACGHRIK